MGHSADGVAIKGDSKLRLEVGFLLQSPKRASAPTLSGDGCLILTLLILVLEWGPSSHRHRFQLRPAVWSLLSEHAMQALNLLPPSRSECSFIRLIRSYPSQSQNGKKQRKETALEPQSMQTTFLLALPGGRPFKEGSVIVAPWPDAFVC